MHACVWTYTHTYTHCKNLKSCDSVKTHPFPRQAGGFRGGNSRASSTWFVFSFTRPFLYDKPEKGGRGEKQKFNIKWNRGTPHPTQGKWLKYLNSHWLKTFWTQTDAWKLTERGKLLEAVSKCLALAEVDVLHFRLLLVLVCSLHTHTHTYTYMPAYTHTQT